MKKLTLILFIAVFLVGCAKEDQNELDLIYGSWTVTSQTVEYFNSSGVKVFSETLASDEGVKKVKFESDNAIFTNNDNSIDESGYSITSDGSKKYIFFNNENISDGDILELTFPSSTTMQWYLKQNGGNYGSGSTAGIAAYTELKVNMAK